jgi:ribonuclease BN (tRNA processing enzyme)
MEKNRLTVLGCGTIVPLKEKNPAGFFLEIGGKKLLLDAGYGAIRRMLDLDIDLQTIDLVFVSHFHPDHFADVFNLVFSRFGCSAVAGEPKIELLILGPKGLEKRFRSWRDIFWPEWDRLNETYPVRISEGKQALELGKVRLETFDVFHVEWFASLGIVIESGGKKIAYTGDLGRENKLDSFAKAAKNADLLICEASLAAPSKSHFSLELARGLAGASAAKKVLIIHVSPSNEEKAEIFCQKEKNFTLARDKMTLEF